MEVPVEEFGADDEPLSGEPLDERILKLVRRCPPSAEHDDGHVIRPGLLVSEIGLSMDDATRELCALMSAVGGGTDGASFQFEKLLLAQDDSSLARVVPGISTMVFTFPKDFDRRARRHRRRSNISQHLQSMFVVFVKIIKIITAFGLIISLAVLIVIGIGFMVAALIALARGGHGTGQRGNHPLMHKLRFLLFELRQILMIYSIWGGATQADPFMSEVARDLAFMLSICCEGSVHPFLWIRMGGRRRRMVTARTLSTRGWSTNYWRIQNCRNDGDAENTANYMIRRGSWGRNEDNERDTRQINSLPSLALNNDQQQRGILSIVVEFLFGPNQSNDAWNETDRLDKWKFRADIIMALSVASQGKGVSLQELLPYIDDPPASFDDESALCQTLTIVSYFNGKPFYDESNETPSCGIDARFYFPEIMAEHENTIINDNSKRCLKFSPPSTLDSNFSSILYTCDNDQSQVTTLSSSTPQYLYETPHVLTHLSQQQFGMCVLLGVINFFGIIWVQNTVQPGGMFSFSTATTLNSVVETSTHHKQSTRRGLLLAASFLLMRLLKILRFYSCLFFVLPLGRLVILFIKNAGMKQRNYRRLNFVTHNL